MSIDVRKIQQDITEAFGGAIRQPLYGRAEVNSDGSSPAETDYGTGYAALHIPPESPEWTACRIKSGRRGIIKDGGHYKVTYGRDGALWVDDYDEVASFDQFDGREPVLPIRKHDHTSDATGGILPAYDAANISYAPSVATDYDDPDPETVGDALNYVAAHIKLLEGGGGGAISGVIPPIVQGRLTLESGVPISTSDQSAKTTLYFAPFRGNVVTLYDTSASQWFGYPFSQISLSLSGFDAHRKYDIWCYQNAGTPTLDYTAWTAPTSASITGCTNAGPPVVTSTAHGLSVGDILTITGVVGSTGINGTFRISAVTTDTFTLVTLAGANPGAPGAYTSGGTWVLKFSGNTRATALSVLNGAYVKNGDNSRLYLGTITINASGGQCDLIFGGADTAAKINVWNYYNRTLYAGHVEDSTTSWSYTVSAYRPAHNSSVNQIEYTCGVSEDLVRARVHARASVGQGRVGVGVQSQTASSAQSSVEGQANGSISEANYAGFPGIGHRYIQWLEYRRVNVTFIGTSTGPLETAGLRAEVWA